MNNTKIWATNTDSFDIKCPVIKWDEPNGFNFIPLRKYGLRTYGYDKLKKELKQFTIHWSATYRAKHTFQGLIARGYSANLIIDDDCNENGYATIYQSLPFIYAGWSQGNGLNTLGAGVEISYQPQAWEEDMYDSNDQKKWNVLPHEIISAPVHGTKLRVHLPTQAQLNSLYQLIWGYCEMFPNVKPEFPKDDNGNYITTVLKSPTTYKGLVNHYHLSRGKIDAAGIDMKKIEEEVGKRLKLGY